MLPTHPWFHAAQDPTRPAVIMADTGETWTYSELTQASNRATRLLRSLGLKPGDTLSILMENRPEFLMLCWAAKNAGFHYVGVSTHLTAQEAGYIVEDSDSRVLIGSAATRDLVAGIKTQLGSRCHYFLVDAGDSEIPHLATALTEFATTIPETPRRGASMLYSSGTTGRPKGVKIPLTDDTPDVPPPRHAPLARIFNLTSATVFFDPGPLYHVGPLRFAMAAQREGGTIVLMRKFEPLQTLSAIESLRITHALFVPTMFVRLLRLEASERRRFSLRSLRVVLHGAAPCPIAIKEQMIEWFGPILYEIYGGTEGSGTTVIDSQDWLTHKGSVGKPMPGCEVHVVDDAGAEVPPLTPGRVFLRSPRTFEYHKDPAKTELVRHPRGWTTLGDIGYVDTEGFLYLTDRQSDMIITGGVNVYPREAENVLQTHPLVADVAVIGVPDTDYGEAVKAIVQLEPGTAASDNVAHQLLDYCRTQLSAMKCPRSIDFIDRLPRQENGKLYKRLLKERYWAGHRTHIV
ncbi:MAG: AMP-binding protein [Steroidobacteraceae bacterium]